MATDKALPGNQLEDLLYAFETEWAGPGQVDISHFVRQHTVESAGAVCELIRIDLEFHWKAGRPIFVEDYLALFSEFKFSPDQINSIAFEEFRVRRQHDSSVSPVEFEERLGLDTSNWPTWDRTCLGEDTARPIDPSLAAHLPSISDTFHGFELVGQLGQGAFGAVYLARETGLSNRLVAVKVTQRSAIEPQSLARLQHTNIIPIYSLKEDEHLQSICMPFLGVATLADLTGQVIDEPSRNNISGRALMSTVIGKRASTLVDSVPLHHSQRVTEELAGERLDAGRSHEIDDFTYRKTILWIAAQVANGLAYAHERGIVHGDLKPGNILLSDNGHPLILDFHLAQNEDRELKKELMVGGTLPYMSSSHLRSLVSRKPIDARCDIFSLGVILHVALTGQFPFEVLGDDDASLLLMASQREQASPSLRNLDPSLPVSVATIVEKCLAAESSGYGSAAEVRDDLKSHLADLPLVHAPNRSLMERLTKWTRRHPRLTSGGSIGSVSALLLVLLSVLLWANSSRLMRSQAETDSRRFVSQVVAVRNQLSALNEDFLVGEGELEDIDLWLSQHTGSDADEYRNYLDKLPASLRSQEISEVSYAHYLLAFQRLKIANAKPASERSQFLEAAKEDLGFVSSLTEQVHPAIQKLRYDLAGNSEAVGLDEKDAATADWEIGDAQWETGKNLMMSGVELYRRRDYNAALSLANKVTAEFPDSASGWLLKGRIHQTLGDDEKADLCFSTAIPLKNGLPWGHVHRGVLRLKRRLFQKAEEDFDLAIDLQPDQPVGYLNRALARIGLKNFVGALEDLERALDLGNVPTRAHYLKSQVLLRLGRRGDAGKVFQKFVALEPFDAKSWITRGLAQIKLGRPEQALKDFQMGLKADPSSTDAYQNIATVQAEYLGDTVAGIEAMSQIIKLKPDDLVARATRGVLLARTGDRRRSHDDGKSVLMRSESADLLFRVAGIFALTSKNDPTDGRIAIQILRKAALENAKLVWGRIRSDQDLDPIRADAEFIELQRQLSQLADGGDNK